MNHRVRRRRPHAADTEESRQSTAPSHPTESLAVESGDQVRTTRRLLADLQSLASRIAAIQEIANSINRCVSLPEIMDVVSRQAKWILDYEYCSVYLHITPQTGVPSSSLQSADHAPIPEQARIEVLHGPPDMLILPQDPQAFAQTLIGQTVITRQAQLVRAGSGQAPPESGFESFMILPLESEGEVVGTLNFAQRHSQAYTQEDMRIAYLLALQLAVAIRNIRRFTQIQQLYTEIEQAYAALQKQNQLREDLTHMVVHDLRSPLTVIRLNLELLSSMAENKPELSNLGKTVRRSQAATDRMLGMIDDMLNLTKLEADELQLVRTPTRVDELWAERESGYQTRAEQEKKELLTSFAPSLPTLHLDVKLMGRVLDNLVTNAFKYTSRGGRIEIGARVAESKDDSQGKARVEIRVQDNGTGIPLEHQPYIFEKFRQVTDASGKPLQEGTGLGLAFCRMVALAHNGTIHVESEPGKGSAFVVTIPCGNIDTDANTEANTEADAT